MITVVIADDGTVTVHAPDGSCNAAVVFAVRTAANEIATRPCTPAPVQPPPAYDVPMTARRGSLDGHLWADGTGHVWDLSLIWNDTAGHAWLWAGWFSIGAPMMREIDSGEQMPLDAIREIYGALSPAAGGAL